MKIKYFYPATLVFFILIIISLLLYRHFGNDNIFLLHGLVKNFSYVTLRSLYVPTLILGALWIILQLNPSLEIKQELKVKKDKVPAWQFPKGAILFVRRICGMVPADWLFLLVNIPLGYILWCMFDVHTITFPAINKSLVIILAVILFAILFLSGAYVSNSCRLSYECYCMFLPLWFIVSDQICVVRIFGILLFYLGFVYGWDYISTKVGAWKYRDGKNKSLLLGNIWFGNTPYDVAIIYTIASWFFTAPLWTIIGG